MTRSSPMRRHGLQTPHDWSPPGGEALDAGLHVRLVGDGDRAILLLHGLAGSNRYFGRSFDLLAEHARMVVPDLFGFGHSPRPHGRTYGPQDHVDALMRMLGELDVDGPLAVVGHSAGALLALHLAGRLGARVRAVVAISPPLYADSRSARAHIARLGLHVRFFATDGRLARLTCGWMCRHRSLAARIFTRIRRDLPAEIAQDGVLHHWESYSGTLKNLIIDGRVDPARIDAATRVLAIAGDADPVLDPGYLRSWIGYLEHGLLEIWPGDHDLPLRSSKVLVERIASWIED